jgi:phosphatidylserine decarboxylase
VGLSFWDVHVVRTPVEGVVKSVTEEGLTVYRNSSETEDQAYLRGRAAPVQAIVTLDTGYGEVKVRLITSYWASRLKVWVHDGDHVKKGDRIGRILLGSSVVAEFQGNIAFDVKPEQRVVGGETIIFSGDKFE